MLCRCKVLNKPEIIDISSIDKNISSTVPIDCAVFEGFKYIESYDLILKGLLATSKLFKIQSEALYQVYLRL